MDRIQELQNIDFIGWIITAFMILSIIVAGYKIISEFLAIIDKPIGSMKQRKEDHKLLTETAKGLKELKETHTNDNKKSVAEDNKISDDLKKLTEMFIDKQIDDYRWEIINFSTKVAEGKPCNKDSFKHCLKTYEKYEKLLKEHGLENGEVDISMEIVNEAYKQNLLEGF